MEIKTEQKTIVQEVKIYVAEDGTVFDTKSECERYEYKLDRKQHIEAAEKLRIKDLDEEMPLTRTEMYGNNPYRWYKLESEVDWEILDKACDDSDNSYYLKKPKQYPAIICIETCGYEPYNGDPYCYLLSDCKTDTEEFWKLFGYEVEFKKI